MRFTAKLQSAHNNKLNYYYCAKTHSLSGLMCRRWNCGEFFSADKNKHETTAGSRWVSFGVDFLEMSFNVAALSANVKFAAIGSFKFVYEDNGCVKLPG